MTRATTSLASSLLLLLLIHSSAIGQTVDPAEFEKVLFPVVIHWLSPVEGAHGSSWMSDVRVVNAHPTEPVWLSGAYGCFMCRTRIPVPPGITFTIMPNSGGPIPGPGSFLHVERGKVDHLAFGLRIRDLNGEERSWGAEVPVIREREFRSDRVNLMNVPLAPLYRVHLRVYSLEPIEGAEVLVRVYAQPESEGVIMGGNNLEPDEVLGETTLTLMTANPSIYADLRPGFAELTDLPTGGYSGSSVRVELVPMDPDLRIWGFISVTNNETNDFTVVSPH